MMSIDLSFWELDLNCLRSYEHFGPSFIELFLLLLVPAVSPLVPYIEAQSIPILFDGFNHLDSFRANPG